MCMYYNNMHMHNNVRMQMHRRMHMHDMSQVVNENTPYTWRHVQTTCNEHA